MDNYKEKFKDPRWQKKRLEILERDDFICQRCFDNTNTLHIHHKIYYNNKEPWEYDNQYLVTLCEDCHKHEKDIINKSIQELTQEIKKKFYATDIQKIASAIKDLPILNCEDYTSDFLMWHLTNKKIIEYSDKKWQET